MLVLPREVGVVAWGWGGSRSLYSRMRAAVARKVGLTLGQQSVAPKVSESFVQADICFHRKGSGMKYIHEFIHEFISTIQVWEGGRGRVRNRSLYH